MNCLYKFCKDCYFTMGARDRRNKIKKKYGYKKKYRN